MKNRRNFIYLMATTSVPILLRTVTLLTAGPYSFAAASATSLAPLLIESEPAATLVKYETISKSANNCGLCRNYISEVSSPKTGTCAVIIGKRVMKSGICIRYVARTP